MFEIDGDGAYSSVHVATVVDHFVSWCNRLAIESRPGHLNLHAAGLVPPGTDGGVLLPGSPGAGKSTLTCGAMAAGWGYLSDELVSLDGHGTAHGYAKPITLKQGTKELLPELDFAPHTLADHQRRWYVRPAELGGKVAASATPHAIVFSTYDPDTPTHAEPISAVEATVELAANSQDELDSVGERLLRLARAASRSLCFRMSRRSLPDAVDILAGIGAQAPRPADPAPLLLEAPPPSSAIRGPRIADDAVAVTLADGVAVHDPATAALVALDPLAGTIWQLLDGSATEAELVEDLAAAFEHPLERVQADVSDLLGHLDEQGLLQRPR